MRKCSCKPEVVFVVLVVKMFVIFRADFLLNYFSSALFLVMVILGFGVVPFWKIRIEKPRAT